MQENETQDQALERVKQIMREAFPLVRPRKSAVYLAGARSVLMQRLIPAEQLLSYAVDCPKHLGLVAVDAWEAGRHEGKQIAKQVGLQKRLAPGVALPASEISNRLRNSALALLEVAQAIQAEVDNDVAGMRLSADSYLPPSLRTHLRFVIVRAGGRLAKTIRPKNQDDFSIGMTRNVT